MKMKNRENEQQETLYDRLEGLHGFVEGIDQSVRALGSPELTKGKTLEEYLREQFNFGNSDAIQSFILGKGQELYKDLIRRLDELFENDSSKAFDEQLFLSLQKDKPFTYHTKSDFLLWKFSGDSKEVEGAIRFDEENVEGFFTSRTNFESYVNNANPFLEELKLQVASEKNRAYGYVLRKISEIKNMFGIGDNLRDLRPIFQSVENSKNEISPENRTRKFELGLREVLAEPESDESQNPQNNPVEGNSTPELYIAGGIDTQPDSVMEKLMGTLSGEEGINLGSSIGYLDRYAQVRNQSFLVNQGVAEYLNKETDPDDAIRLFQGILGEIDDLRPNEKHTDLFRDLDLVLNGLKVLDGKEQKPINTPTTNGEDPLGDLIWPGIETGEPDPLENLDAFGGKEPATIGELPTNGGHILHLKPSDLERLDSSEDGTVNDSENPSQISSIVSPNKPRNYLNLFTPLEINVIGIIDNHLLPPKLEEYTVDLLLAGNLDGAIKNIREVGRMPQDDIGSKLTVISYGGPVTIDGNEIELSPKEPETILPPGDFERGLDGIKNKLNLESMSGGSKVKKLWLKYGSWLSAAAAGGIVAAAGAYAMFSGYDISQFFIENQVDTSGLGTTISNIGSAINLLSIEHAFELEQKGVTHAALQTANESMLELDLAVDEFTIVKRGDNTWKSVEELGQVVDTYNPIDNSTTEIVADVSIANDRMTPEAWNELKPEELRYPDGDYTKVNGQNPHLWLPGDKMRLGNILSGMVESAKFSIQGKVQGAQLSYEQAANAVSGLDVKLANLNNQMSEYNQLEETASRSRYLKNISPYMVAIAAAGSALLTGIGSWLGISYSKRKSLANNFPNNPGPEDQPPDGGSTHVPVTEDGTEEQAVDLVVASGMNKPGEGMNLEEHASDLNSIQGEYNSVSDLVLKASVSVTEGINSTLENIGSKVKNAGNKAVNYLKSIGGFGRKFTQKDTTKSGKPYKTIGNVIEVNFNNPYQDEASAGLDSSVTLEEPKYTEAGFEKTRNGISYAYAKAGNVTYLLGTSNQTDFANDAYEGNDLGDRVNQESEKTQVHTTKSGRLYASEIIGDNAVRIYPCNPDQEEAAEPVEKDYGKTTETSLEHSKKTGSNTPIKAQSPKSNVSGLDDLTDQVAHDGDMQVVTGKNGELCIYRIKNGEVVAIDHCNPDPEELARPYLEELKSIGVNNTTSYVQCMGDPLLDPLLAPKGNVVQLKNLNS